jgi:hypothetical protein
MATSKPPIPETITKPLNESQSMEAIPSNEYNTRFLPQRVAADSVSAICTSVLVAPLITIIDKSIIQKTHQPLTLQAIILDNVTTACRSPLKFLRSTPYLLIQALYFSTYFAANITDTITSTVKNKPITTVTPGTAKFLATSTVNLSGCLYKDARFTKFFGAGGGKGAVKKVVPKTSFALFALRDSMTMFASFNVPPLLAPVIGSLNAAQMLAPASMQLLSTPLHLLGLDLYNRPKGPVGAASGVTIRDRWIIIKRDWLGASFARMGRIVPAYGIGGVVNSRVRRELMNKID